VVGADFALLIDLTFPSPESCAAFSGMLLDAFPNKCPDPFKAELPVRFVSDALAEWKEMGSTNLSMHANRWTLSGFFGEDAFNDLAPELAALAHLAAQTDAGGKAIACCIEFPDGYLITLTPSEGTRIERLKKAEAGEIQLQPWVARALEDAVE
jgi:hypothetical protein